MLLIQIEIDKIGGNYSAWLRVEARRDDGSDDTRCRWYTV